LLIFGIDSKENRKNIKGITKNEKVKKENTGLKIKSRKNWSDQSKSDQSKSDQSKSDQRKKVKEIKKGSP
jgi:hypothetical protein